MTVKLGKSYASVFDMLREELPEYPELLEAAFGAYKRDQISNSLQSLRMRFGVTREELASRSGLSMDRIAKMEDSGDSVKFNDMIKFVEALDCSVKLMFQGRDANLTKTLQWHFQAIAAIMAKFIDMAKDDPDISSGIFERFRDEAGNMLNDVLPKCDAMLARAKPQNVSAAAEAGDGVIFERHSKNGTVLV